MLIFSLGYLNKALSFRDNFEKNWNANDWSLATNDEAQQLNIWLRTSPAGLKAVKASAPVDHSPEEIALLMFDQEKKKEYDKTYDSSRVLMKVGHQTYITQHQSKKVNSFIAARDFVYLMHFNRTPEGTIYILVQSVERDDLMAQ